MLISKKTRKKLTVSALFAAPVAMSAVGVGVVSADTVHTPDKTQNTVSTNSATSSANSSAASSATSSAPSLTASASDANYRTVVVQPDSAMTNYMNQAAANGMKGEIVATITDGIHNKGDNTSDSTVTVNDGGSVTVTLADANTLAGTMTTTFSNGMVLTSTITNGKMSTQVTTEPTSDASSSATSSDTSSDTSSSGNDSFSDAVSVHSSAASSAASSTASAAYEATTDVSTTRKPVSSDKYASYEATTDASTASEAVPSASRNASYAPSKSPAFPDTSGSLTSGTKVTAFTMNKNDPEYVKNHDGNEYAKFSTNQSIDLFVYYWAKLKAAATDAGLSDSQYFKLLDAASQPGGDVYNKLVNDEDLTDDQKAELVTDAYQLARQIADKDSNYTLSDVNTTNNTPNGGDDGDIDYSKDDGNGDPSDTYGDDGNGDNSNNSAKTLPQAGEEDTSSMSVAGMAMAGAVSLAGMIGSKRVGKTRRRMIKRF